MSTRIPYTKPSITSLEIEYAADAVTNGWGEHCYDYIDRFESDFQEHLGARHVIATSSCCLLYTSPSPRDRTRSRMPSSA